MTAERRLPPPISDFVSFSRQGIATIIRHVAGGSRRLPTFRSVANCSSHSRSIELIVDCTLAEFPAHRVARSLLVRALHHLHNGQRLAVPERDGNAFDFNVAFPAVKRDTGECGAHFEMAEACCAG